MGPRGPRRGHARRGVRARLPRRHALDRRELRRGALGPLLDARAAGRRAAQPPRRRERRRGFHQAFVELYESYRSEGGRIRAPRRYLLVLGRRALRPRSAGAARRRRARSRRSRSTSRRRVLGPRRRRRRPLPRLRALGAAPARRVRRRRPSRARCRCSPAAIRPASAEPACRAVASTVGEWERSWDDDGYAAAIEAVRAAIARGDVYQVNLVQHLSAPFAGDPAALAAALAPLRPLHAAAVRRRRLGDRLGLAGALPRAARPAGS